MEHATSRPSSEPRLLLDAVDGDVAVFRGLVPLFLQETVDRYADIVRFSEAGRFADMGQEAHALKGTAITIGATVLVQLLQQIEEGGLRRRIPCSVAQRSRLSELLQLAREDMESFLGTLPPA